jgi:16S rRNA (guanine527-N7)-methyltransferase
VPTLVDVGSGAGLPGAVCALMRPELRVTLAERIGKKAAFLLTLRRELGLPYEVFADDAAKLRERYGLVVSRAALPLPRWLALATTLVAPGGLVLAMTSLSEPLPAPPSPLALTDARTYDVGAGPYRLLTYTATA